MYMVGHMTYTGQLGGYIIAGSHLITGQTNSVAAQIEDAALN